MTLPRPPLVGTPEAREKKGFPWILVLFITLLLVCALCIIIPELLPRRCIVEGMMVDTPTGARPIQDLRPGDEVWSRTTAGSPVAGRVVQVFPARSWGYLRIRFSDGGVLCATGAHPIATASGFIAADSLRPGMVVQGSDGLRTIASIDAPSSLTRVYDLEIAPESNFIAAGVLVHNKSRGDRHAASCLKTLASAQANFRASDRDGDLKNDFWVGDVAGLYCTETNGQPIKLIELRIAAADIAPKTNVAKWAAPGAYLGYFFSVVPFKADGTPYDDGSNQNSSAFAVCAFPAKYENWSKYTLIVDECNTIYRKDIPDPKRIMRWPKDLVAEGWTKLD
jgi:hypothetical protein